MNNRLKKTWLEWRGVIVFFLLIVFLRSSIANWYGVPTASMNPAILEGDRIFVNLLAYDAKVPFTNFNLGKLGEPRRGDIVVFYSPEDGTRLVKRLIGIPGDSIAMRNDRLFINGEWAEYQPNQAATDARVLLRENVAGSAQTIYLTPQKHTLRDFGPIKIPENNYLFMGDNRNNSRDSRYFGLVNRELLIGRANTVLISLDPENYYLPRGGRIFHTLK